MGTIEKTVYKFSELSDSAKEHARYKWAENGGFDGRDTEYTDSIKALAEHFGGRVKDYSIDWSHSSYSEMSFEMPEQPDSGMSKTAWDKYISGKLRDLGTFNRRTLKGHGDCKLTGMCYDESAIDGFRWAWYREKKRTLSELMDAAYDEWIKAAWADYEYDIWGEGFPETCEANEYEFDEDGDLV